MATDESFKDYILDQLVNLENITAKRMFGGYGLYSGKTFFGIISEDSVYFKTNKDTRKRYIDLSMKPFAPSKKQVLKNYYQVPEEVIEDGARFADFAKEAIDIACL